MGLWRLFCDCQYSIRNASSSNTYTRKTDAEASRRIWFTKIDLADAYNQIAIGPESQKRLALSTHQGVLLEMRLPFGIMSALGYFQEIMNQLTSDLPGVAVYLDDILVSGSTAQEHLSNLKRLLQRLSDKVPSFSLWKEIYSCDRSQAFALARAEN